MVRISLLSSDLNEDFAHCKYLHTATVENLKDMKANEVGRLSVSTLYISILLYTHRCVPCTSICLKGCVFRATSIKFAE